MGKATTSLFSKVCDSDLSAWQVMNDVKKITEWAYKSKIIFSPTIYKQDQKVVFTRKTGYLLPFNNTVIKVNCYSLITQ